MNGKCAHERLLYIPLHGTVCHVTLCYVMKPMNGKCGHQRLLYIPPQINASCHQLLGPDHVQVDVLANHHHNDISPQSSYEKKGHGLWGAQWTTDSFLCGASRPNPTQGSPPASRSFLCTPKHNHIVQEILGKDTRKFGFNTAAPYEGGWTTFDPIPYKKQERLVGFVIPIKL